MRPTKDLSAEIKNEQRALSNYASAYDPEIRSLLGKLNERLVQATNEFSVALFQKLSEDKSALKILKHLTSDECVSLQHAHAEHLCQLLSPEAMADTHFTRATEIGRIHELVGLRLYMLFDTYHLFQREMQDCLGRLDLTLHQRERLELAIQQRLILDLEGQITSHYEVDAETVVFLQRLDLQIQTSNNLPDLLRNAVSVITGIHGVAAGLFLRPNINGCLQIEVAEGQFGPAYAELIDQRKVSQIHIARDVPEGQGPGGQAWRTGQIVTVDSAESISELAPWASAWEQLGFRSSATVPLLDHNERPFALLAIYSLWRGVFATPSSQLVLHYIQQALSHAVMRYELGETVPIRRRNALCRLLEEGSVEMLYQPVVDLKTGDLHCVEVLARLREQSGSLILPGTFLRAFGKSDLLRLFRLVMERAGEAFTVWRDHGLEIPVSINLPPDGLIDDSYMEVLFNALDRGPLTVQNLRFEILETRDPLNLDKRDARIMELRRAGIAILQDDLGSGHSSLLRMEHIPFDGVKIDQGLVRGAMKHPQRVVEFICHLTRLAHGFSLGVTVEGLENAGLVEAAAVLGADRGQGFDLGRPMTASEVLSWREHCSYTVDPQHPKTPFGVLAQYFLWDQQLSALSRFPNLIEPFVRDPSGLPSIADSSLLGTASAGLLQSRIDEALASALKSPGSKRYERSKRLLIETLSELCLVPEVSGRGAQMVAKRRHGSKAMPKQRRL